jgi:hypothetical protein
MATTSPIRGRAAELTGRSRECDVLDRLIEDVAPQIRDRVATARAVTEAA